MLKARDNTPVWEQGGQAPPGFPSLQGDMRCDVAIVGAGYTGLSAALRLAEAGKRVAVLESHHIGRGGSGRNAGMVNSGLWLDPEDVIDALDPQEGTRLNAALSKGPSVVFDLIEKHKIECAAQRSGSIQLAYSDDDATKLKQRCAQMESLGGDVQILSGNDCAAVTGTPRYEVGLVDRNAGCINPLAYCRGLSRTASQAGAAIFENSKVISLKRSSDSWHCRTGSGTLAADWVLLATNALTAEGQFQIHPQPVIPVPFFQLVSEPLGSAAEVILPRGHCAWDTRDVAFCFRKIEGDRLVMGSVGSLDGLKLGLAKAWLNAEVKNLFPTIGQAAWSSGWTGTIGFTPSHVPSFYRPAPNMIAPAGYNGRGIGPGTIFGANIADYMISGAEDDLILRFRTPDKLRFARQRAAIMDWGATAKRAFQSLKQLSR